MNTIDELMEDKKPGEIKIQHRNWGSDTYFIPYFKDGDNHWHGLREGNMPDFEIGGGWSIYQKPKKKIKKWLWVLNGSDYCISNSFYTEGYLSEDWIKIPWSEMEFEE